MQKFFQYITFVLVLVCAHTNGLSAQDEINGDAANGYKLFQKNCKSCHKIEGVLVGPQLGGVVARLNEEQGLGRDWLQKWIKNNAELRASGDKYANQVFQEYNQSEMLAFPDLSEQDIDDILSYTISPEEGEQAAKLEDAKPVVASSAPEGFVVDPLYMIVGFTFIALMLIWVIVKVNQLTNSLADPELSDVNKEVALSLSNAFTKYKKFSYLIMMLVGVLAFYGFWESLLSVGVDKGYKPEQPIYFSHKIHAGIQKIDCQYCHSSAKYSKHSGIPSTNVCMNCHKVINEYGGEYVEDGKSKEFYTSEISKIYESSGWDPDNQEYSGEEKPIEWVRIHNMPDFVYFNHKQHITAGKNAILKAIEDKTIPNYDGLNMPSDNVQVCYACHGNVSEMNEVSMANTFVMGWCVECHRTTEVDVENGYNKINYKDYHDKLKDQYGTKLTVEEMGGLECGKCHY